MSAPKLLRILQAVAARVQAISQADGHYSDVGADVRLDRYEPNVEDLPASLVFLGERVREDHRPGAAKAQQSLVIAAYVKADSRGSEEIAIQLLADIQRAVELEDTTLGGLLQGTQYGLAWAGDEILQPNQGEHIVGAQVTYAIPHIRKSGDPEIA